MLHIFLYEKNNCHIGLVDIKRVITPKNKVFGYINSSITEQAQ